MLYEMFSLLGSPTQSTWPKAWDLAYELDFRFPKLNENNLSNAFNDKDLATPEVIDLLYKMLMMNPDFRWSAEKCYNHPFFEDLRAQKKLDKDSYFDTNGDLLNIDERPNGDHYEGKQLDYF